MPRTRPPVPDEQRGSQRRGPPSSRSRRRQRPRSRRCTVWLPLLRAQTQSERGQVVIIRFNVSYSTPFLPRCMYSYLLPSTFVVRLSPSVSVPRLCFSPESIAVRFVPSSLIMLTSELILVIARCEVSLDCRVFRASGDLPRARGNMGETRINSPQTGRLPF